jgi:hypothetical protein
MKCTHVLAQASRLLESRAGVEALVRLCKSGKLLGKVFQSRKLNLGTKEVKLDSFEAKRPCRGSCQSIPYDLRVKTVAPGLAGLEGYLTGLDLSGHERLQHVPVEEWVKIKSLKTFECAGCRRLFSVPSDVAQQGGTIVMHYLRLTTRVVEQGHTSTSLLQGAGAPASGNAVIELVFAGADGSGKTSVIESLLAEATTHLQAPPSSAQEPSNTPDDVSSQNTPGKRSWTGASSLQWDVHSSQFPDAVGMTFRIKDLAGSSVYRLSDQYLHVESVFVLVWRVVHEESSDDAAVGDAESQLRERCRVWCAVVAVCCVWRAITCRGARLFP